MCISIIGSSTAISACGQRVLLELLKRRLRYAGCRKVFMEPNEVCRRQRRSTGAFRRALAEACRVAMVTTVAVRAGESEAPVQSLERDIPEML